MLAPVVLVFALVIRMRGESESLEKSLEGKKRPPLVPGFVLGFLLLAGINSLNLIPEAVGSFLTDLSRWALLTAISAVGMKTSLRRIFDVGSQAIILIVAETLFIGVFILAGVHFLA